MKIKTLLMPITLAAGMALSAGVPAQEVDNDFSIYAGGVRYLFDTHKDQQNEEGYSIGLEFPLFDRVSLAVEHYEVDSDFKNQRGESDFSLDRLGFNYHLNMLGNWQPYMSLGFGDLELDPRPTGFGPVQLDETSYDLGVGIKRDFGEYFMVRGDLKGIHGRQTSDWDTVIGISAGFTFGGARQAPPPAPEPEPAPIVAAPVDSDGDGVNDPSDRCPNTPRQLAVDANGCPILQTTQESQELLVEFEFDSDVVRPEYNGEIEAFAEFMQTYTNTEVVIEGHTDSTGPEEYNQGLSERRANAVREALIEAGIPASRITAVGHGESRPVAGNDNPEGRERNRRIVAEVSVEVEEEVLR